MGEVHKGWVGKNSQWRGVTKLKLEAASAYNELFKEVTGRYHKFAPKGGPVPKKPQD